MGLKKVAAALVVVGIVVAVVVGLKRGSRRGPENVLRLYTWSSYLPDEALQEFTKQTGATFQLSYYSSNEELLAKLKAGARGYDLIMPSDYMVRQMARLKMLAPLDHAKIPNLKHLDAAYRDVPYDPGQVNSVPFTWGTTGIAVNTAKVKVPAEGFGWDFVLNSVDPQHTSLLDDMREVFAVGLRIHQKPINATDPKALALARADIQKAKSHILMFTSEPKALLLKGELTVSHSFSHETIQANRENPAIRYYLPKEGGTIWTDNLAIPASSERQELAHRFIDFLLQPEIAVKVSHEKKLGTTNRTAREQLPAEDRDDPQLFPPAEEMKKAQFLEDIGESLQPMSRLWTELKS